jgi:hypothetical protein
MKNKTVSAAELARRSGYSPSAIVSWTRAKILKRDKGRYALVESLEAIKRHEQSRGSDGSHEDEGLTDLRRELLTARIRKLDFELSVAMGKVHDRTACCQSLLAIHSAESRILHGMAGRVATKFPEVNGLAAAITTECDEILAALKSGSAYNVALTCPHCKQIVEQLVAVESQEVAA